MLENIVNIADLSKYRTRLMGIAIINVLLSHVLYLGQISLPSIFNPIETLLCYSLFTQGFLFLSGMGLYYSLSTNFNLLTFYKRRLVRAFIPYIILSMPYFAFSDICVNHSIQSFLLHISTVSFWVSGNFSGMWYFSLLLLLYSVSPILYLYLKKDQSFLFLLLATEVLRFILSIYCKDYYEMTSIATTRILSFLMGMYVMKLIAEKRNLTLKTMVTISLLYAIFWVLRRYFTFFIAEEYAVSVMFFSLLFSALFNIFDPKIHKVADILDWLGKLTLELYVIHLLLYHVLTDFGIVSISPLLSILFSVILAVGLCKPANVLINKCINKINI